MAKKKRIHTSHIVNAIFDRSGKFEPPSDMWTHLESAAQDNLKKLINGLKSSKPRNVSPEARIEHYVNGLQGSAFIESLGVRMGHYWNQNGAGAKLKAGFRASLQKRSSGANEAGNTQSSNVGSVSSSRDPEDGGQPAPRQKRARPVERNAQPGEPPRKQPYLPLPLPAEVNYPVALPGAAVAASSKRPRPPEIHGQVGQTLAKQQSVPGYSEDARLQDRNAAAGVAASLGFAEQDHAAAARLQDENAAAGVAAAL